MGASDDVMKVLPKHKAFTNISINESVVNSHFNIQTNLFENEKLAILNLAGEFMEPYSLEEFKAKSFEIMEKCE